MANWLSSNRDARPQLTGVLEALARSPNFQSQALVLAGWMAGQPSAAREALREAANFWSVRVAQLWGDEDWTDRELVRDLLKTYGRPGRFDEMLRAVQEMLVGDDRFDAVIADAVSQAILAAVDYDRLSDDQLDKLLASLA
jgi:hypothetical protein